MDYENSEQNKGSTRSPRVRDELGVYIGNLPSCITEDEIKALISAYDNVEFLRLIKKDPKTFCFLRCPNKETVINVVRGLHKKEIMGRKICVKASNDDVQKSLFSPESETHVREESSTLNSMSSGRQFAHTVSSPCGQEGKQHVHTSRYENETTRSDGPPPLGLLNSPSYTANSARIPSAHVSPTNLYHSFGRESKDPSKNVFRGAGPPPLAIRGSGPPPLTLAHGASHSDSGYSSRVSSVDITTSDSYQNYTDKGPPSLGAGDHAGSVIRSDGPPPLAPHQLLNSYSSHISRISPSGNHFAESSRHTYKNIDPQFARCSKEQQQHYHDFHRPTEGIEQSPSGTHSISSCNMSVPSASAANNTSAYQNVNSRETYRTTNYMPYQQNTYEYDKLSSRFTRQDHLETEFEYTEPQVSDEEKQLAIKDLESAEFLLVSNFPFHTTEEDIFYLFEDFEPLGVWITNNGYNTGRCTEAYVAVPNEKLALDAIMQFDNTTYRRRLLLVTDAKHSNIVSELLELYGYSTVSSN